MGRQVGKQAGRQADKHTREAIGHTSMNFICWCFLIPRCSLLFFPWSSAFLLFTCFLFSCSFLSLQTDTAGHAHTVDSFSTTSWSLTLGAQARMQSHRLTAIRNLNHLSRLLRSRGIGLLWFGLSTSLRDELLHVSSHDAALRPCRCGLADVHICLPSQFLSIGAGNHSTTCRSPWQLTSSRSLMRICLTFICFFA